MAAMGMKLADMGVAFLQDELLTAQQAREALRKRHDVLVSEILAHDTSFKAEEDEWIAIQLQRQRENKAARTLQSWWLRVGMQHSRFKHLIDMLEQQRLHLAHRRLDEALLDLQHLVHDLHVGDADKEAAALKLQRWWRRVLAERVRKVVAYYASVREVKRRVEGAASKIQALYRGVCARRHVQEVRESKQAAEAEAERRMEQMKMHAILNIQNSYRKSVAVKQVQNLRAQMLAAMVSQGETDHLRSKTQPTSARPLWYKSKGGKADARKKR